MPILCLLCLVSHSLCRSSSQAWKHTVDVKESHDKTDSQNKADPNLCQKCIFLQFDRVDGLGFAFDRVNGLCFAFDVFCVILLFLASQSLLLLNCWHCQELLYYFFDWRWIKINPKCLRIRMYSFLKAFLVLMKLLGCCFFCIFRIVFRWFRVSI